MTTEGSRQRSTPSRHRASVAIAALAAVGVAAAMLVGSAPARAAQQPATFDGWSQALAGSPDLTFSAALEADAYDGQASLRIDNATPKSPNVYGQIYQTVPVQPATAYTFSAWVKASNLSTAAGA